jgi:hypothetical protein
MKSGFRPTRGALNIQIPGSRLQHLQELFDIPHQKLNVKNKYLIKAKKGR